MGMSIVFGLYFLNKNCQRILINDLGKQVVVNDLFGIMSFDKILSDAKERNIVLFDKLNMS